MALWAKVQAYYEAYDMKDRSPTLVEKATQKDGKTIWFLWGNAAFVKALVHFGHLTANELLDDANPAHAAAKRASEHLFT